MSFRGVLWILALNLFNPTFAHAGCPAISALDVTGSFLSCKEARAPDGKIVEVKVVSRAGQPLGLEMKPGETRAVFFESDQKVDCKAFRPRSTVCLNLQRWCGMAGPQPHGIGLTGYGLKPGPCRPAR